MPSPSYASSLWTLGKYFLDFMDDRPVPTITCKVENVKGLHTDDRSCG
jgi:hypothetical protein